MPGIEITRYLPPPLQVEIGETTPSMKIAAGIVTQCLNGGIPLLIALEGIDKEIRVETLRVVTKSIWQTAADQGISKEEALREYMRRRNECVFSREASEKTGSADLRSNATALKQEKRILAKKLHDLPRTEPMTVVSVHFDG